MQSAKSSPALDLAHAPALMSLAARLAGASQDAEDLVQATYVRALESRQPVKQKRSWLRRVLVNERNMAVRGRIRRGQRELRHAVPEGDPDMEHVLHCLEVGRVVQKLVDELDDDVALVVRERYFAGQSAAQIARDQKIPAGTVRWRLKNGLDELRERLDRHYGGQRALWAGALVPGGLSPTLGGGSASTGMSAGNMTSPAAKGSPLMSFKVLATTLALVTAGTGAAYLANAGESDARTTAPKPGDTSLPTGLAAKRAEPEHPTKRAWQARRAKIRSANASALANRAATAAAATEKETGPTVLTLCDGEPCAPDALDDALGGCDGTVCLTTLVEEVSTLMSTCKPFLADAPADLMVTAHVIGAPDVGTVVETVDLNSEHETPAELAECLTEAMYALDLGERDAPFEETLTLAVSGNGPGESPVLANADPETIAALQRTLAGLTAEDGAHVHTLQPGSDISGVLSEAELDDETRKTIEAAFAGADDGSEVHVVQLPDSHE